MLIACDNKGCLKMSNALLNKETKEVICAECKKPIKSVTEHMKRVLISSGQIVRDEDRKAFTMACLNCNANRQVVLDNKGNTVCHICGHYIGVHPAMKQAIIEAGVKLKKQIPKKDNTNTKKKVRRTTKKKTTRKTKA